MTTCELTKREVNSIEQRILIPAKIRAWSLYKPTEEFQKYIMPQMDSRDGSSSIDAPSIISSTGSQISECSNDLNIERWRSSWSSLMAIRGIKLTTSLPSFMAIFPEYCKDVEIIEQNKFSSGIDSIINKYVSYCFMNGHYQEEQDLIGEGLIYKQIPDVGESWLQYEGMGLVYEVNEKIGLT
eukprot:GHVP01028605.1.p1 GENE.GHVP01028605.1~~GHVP01028605.1.p1  ORF type:complete len:183 (+),score=21.63 GHVP01028605.1:540-1088(+)